MMTIIFFICFAPIAFAFWVIWQTILIVVRFLSFDIACASVKRKNPELYRQMKREGARLTCGCRSPFWIIKRNR